MGNDWTLTDTRGIIVFGDLRPSLPSLTNRNAPTPAEAGHFALEDIFAVITAGSPDVLIRFLLNRRCR